MKTRFNIKKEAASANYSNDRKRWNAILHRDPNADGKFFYSVKTTGVYCRPCCPARPALKKNVRFHTSTEDAEKNGFRACKRCRPQSPPLHEQRAFIITKACRTIEATDELPDLRALSKTAGMSRFHFHRVFKEMTGLTPKAYVQEHRAKKMRTGLLKCDTVTEAMYKAGFNSNSRFYSKSSHMLGMKPSHFRSGGIGETIRFAIGKCSLGSILVAASDIGICAISLGDDPGILANELQKTFSKARLIGGDRKFEQWMARVIGFIEAPKVGLDLPLDVRGSAFQLRVWNALRRIPPGSTASYSEVAELIGSPKSNRAVASACAANNIAIAIPCHRVLRLNGNLSGYRWGVKRKQALLDREKEKSSKQRAKGKRWRRR